MSDTVDDWRALISQAQAIQRKINSSPNQVRSVPLRDEVRGLAQSFFRQIRLGLVSAGLDSEVHVLSDLFSELLRLAEGASTKAKYLEVLKALRSMSAEIVTRLETDRGKSLKPELTVTVEDEQIMKTLQGLVPAAALSYQQAIADLADDSRVSFRGPALELREALREALDHLAPNEEVEAMDGYKREPERKGPTMKQKVRFIRSARGLSKSSGAVPEQTTTTIDELVGTLTRSVYDMSSVATHVAKERKAVVRIKLYVVAVLHEMLEI
jgi:hypothetical protein